MINIHIPRKPALINFAEQLVRRATESRTSMDQDLSFVHDFPVEETTEVASKQFVPTEILDRKKKSAERSKELLEKTKFPQSKTNQTKRLAIEKPARVAGLHGLIHFDSGKVELKWHNQDEANYYTVQFNENSYDELQWKTLSTSTLARVEVNSLEKGKEYYFRVKAHAEDFSGEWSGLCCLKLKKYE